MSLIDAHICQGGDRPGRIRKYPGIVCSICMNKNAVEIQATEESIDEYNRVREYHVDRTETQGNA